MFEKYINNEKLKENIDRWFVKVNKHPEEDIYILNYTNDCQLAYARDEVNMQCRGLILDQEWNIIAKPFKKFFNRSEVKEKPTWMPNYILEKVDGSLWIIYYYKWKRSLASRGSFDSKQAIKWNKMLSNIDMTNCPTNYTYLVEIIYPENRIVVDYKWKSWLVYLWQVDRNTWEEFFIENWHPFTSQVKQYSF